MWYSLRGGVDFLGMSLAAVHVLSRASSQAGQRVRSPASRTQPNAELLLEARV